MNFRFATTLLSLAAAAGSAAAQTSSNKDEAVYQLAPFTVTEDVGPFVNTPLVGNQSLITNIELEGINATTVEDAVKYLPNMNIRKRFIGDTNGVTSIRGQNTWMTGRSIVTVDGVLLSNFLQTRWQGAPRWAAVAPDEIQYAEVEYGPYSAFSSGNSLGGSIKLYTRMPERREGLLKTTFFSQDYSLYGTSKHYNGYKTFASYGDEVGDFSLYAFYNHMENDSQPQTYGDAIGLVEASGEEVEAAGAFLDVDPRGRGRVIYSSPGANSFVHDQFKLKARYDFSDSLQAQYSVVYWKNDLEQLQVENYLSDASGNPLWGGVYRSNGYAFSVNPGDFKVSRRDREDILMGFTLGGDLGNDWVFDSTISYFDVLEDETRESSRNPLDPKYDKKGRATWFDNTDWLTFDFKAGSERFLDNDRLSFFAGYHYSDYGLQLFQSNSNDWEAGTRDSVRNNTGGSSSQQAVYAQFGSQLGEYWRLVGGSRLEWWDASGGYVQNKDGIAYHPNRSQSKNSPKLSLDFQRNAKWKATLNLAKASRFPLVPELFQGRVGADGRVDRNNPDLKPEDALATELSVTRYTEGGQARLTVFRDEVDDAIFNLLNSDLRYSLFLNIDEVRTKGVEFVYDQRSFLKERLDLRFNASYTNSEIVKNSANRAYEGNAFPRIPEWRLNLFATYRLSEKVSLSLGGRHQSHSFNRLENDDYGGGYGSISEFLVFDSKLNYRFNDAANLSFGVDNVFDEAYFVHHSYPQRTWFAEGGLRF